jgi:hypothetical protein
VEKEIEITPEAFQAVCDAVAHHETYDDPDYLTSDGGLFLTPTLVRVIVTAACKSLASSRGGLYETAPEALGTPSASC